jgi:hypothetical protein
MRRAYPFAVAVVKCQVRRASPPANLTLAV